MNIDYLRDKKVAVLGLSVEGLATAKFLLDKGIPLTLLDKKELVELGEEALRIAGYRGVKTKLGKGYLGGLGDFEVIFRTPGFPLWEPHLQAARKSGVVVTSQTKLFFDLCPCPIIGVTGTKGKGTTAALIYEMLKAAGKGVYLGGNIGQPPLAFLEKLAVNSLAVLELSSFQLEDMTVSPRVAVVLMVTSEHLASAAPDSPNYHRNREEYWEAKKNIVRYQKPDDYAVINFDCEISRLFGGETKAQSYYFGRLGLGPRGTYVKDGAVVFRQEGRQEKVCSVEEIFLRGRHNWENVCAAVTVAKILGVSLAEMRGVIKTFKGLAHRLELVAEVGGVKYYDDSFSTTPETAVAAIGAFNEPLVIILGGSEKNSDYTKLGRVVSRAKNLKAVLLIGQTAGRIRQAVREAGGFPRGCAVAEDLGSMKEVVAGVQKFAAAGDVVLLSPACASFDMFKNYKDRGEQFKEEVSRLIENTLRLDSPSS